MIRQQWQDRRFLYKPSGDCPWMRSHAQIPTPIRTPTGELRVYFGVRDERNRTSTVYLDVNAEQPSQVKRLHDTPVLPLGELGCFDDAGVMPSSVVNRGSELRLYYSGWNTSTTVPYRLAIGLAVSTDGGQSFERPFAGPILDRTPHEPHFSTSPSVLYDGGVWRMWYSSCTGWQVVHGKPEPRYLIRYAESDDGIEWRRPATIVIDYAREDEAIARPWVVKQKHGYQMWFCTRSIADYRRDRQQSYRLGYAESADGLTWTRCDEAVELPPSRDGWDAEMIAYPAVIDVGPRRLLFYNGNGFGAAGFGVAELQGR